MFRLKNKIWKLVAALVVIFGLGGFLQRPANGNAALTQGVQRFMAWGKNNSAQSKGSTTSQGENTPPTKQEASVVLTPEVRQQLGNNIVWNGHGAFIINNNHSGLNANISSAPYAVNQVDSRGRAWRGDAWLNKTTRQYQNRSTTGNGATNWKPAGFLQAYNLTGGYSHAYDRGHLLGYALVGGIKGFDASESNPKNIATQTAWANEARSSTSTGQNYYEGIVRQALDQGKQVRYRVTDIYSGTSIVPAGAHIQAQSKDGSVDFNVFVPNVQNNIEINYATGAVKQIEH
ncbi:DNA/RNA non-specific endonuclease [Limosilactobacillus sp.]|jgi:DNA-entry nuclease|uniref:DNA/RNA non-specific endonuclease n=1 Tax=Limosilactobacillus sp. TaxID=2773925 RepID=UPI0025C584A7|nr:DNA/RNA non-specific endonuclease [Limosilactobacillus sp.]MCH3922783.1 DNA/RNA non-specific endonuclease [Limosilactobacillus sp.]MCH3927466.1 DNA/RNA non-specific endonuclease [Limosilactobacillus sp.]